MPHISREDGVHFVVPSYRDLLSAKKPALLKKEILLLSSNYGNYITLQRKNTDQYEAAFASEPGFLLGESVWLYFNKPNNLIYCEEIKGTSEALLVIVKAGSVYLDGSFPVDTIADELVVFKTQTGRFEIYVHGNVPISEKTEPEKISLGDASVKSFTVLPDPLFATLPTPKEYELGLTEVVLRSQGIGVLPVRKIALASSAAIAIGCAFLYFSLHQEQAPKIFVATFNPWQSYFDTLNSAPAASEEIMDLIHQIRILYTAPGWMPLTLKYTNGILSASMGSGGVDIAPLYAWAHANDATFNISSDGISIAMKVKTHPRAAVKTYSPLQQVIGETIDNARKVWTNNGVFFNLGDVQDRGEYSTIQLAIGFKSSTPQALAILAAELANLPLVLQKADIEIEKSDGTFDGKFIFQALGK